MALCALPGREVVNECRVSHRSFSGVGQGLPRCGESPDAIYYNCFRLKTAHANEENSVFEYNFDFLLRSAEFARTDHKQMNACGY